MTEMPVYPESLLAQTDWLHRLTRELVGDSHAADDLVQDTFLAALGRPAPDRAGLRTWLERIARNLAAGATRARYRRQRREARVARDADQAEPSTADTIAQFGVHRSVVDAVTSLAEPVRTTFLLRYWEDLPPRAIAERMGVPVETVRTRLKRGLRSLRGRLDEEHGDRRAWVLPLVAIPIRGATVSTSALSLATLVIIMKTKTVAVGVAAVLGVVGAFAWWSAASVDQVAAKPEALLSKAAEVPGSPDRPGSAAAVAAKRKENVPEEDRAPVVEAGEWIRGRVLDDESRPIPDVELCVIAPKRIDEYRRDDGPELSGRKLRVARCCAILALVGSNGLADQREMFQPLLSAKHITRSDENGEFRFDRNGVREGDLIGVWSPVVGCRFEPVVLDGESMRIRCETWPRVLGRVSVKGGKLGAPARVIIGRFDPFTQYHLKTATDGSYASPQIPPGLHYVRFEVDRHRDESEPRFELTEDRVIDKTLAPLWRMHTLLVDARGRAWTAARMAATGWKPKELRFLLTREDFQTLTALDAQPRTRTTLEFAGDEGTLTGYVEDTEAHFISVWCKNARVTAAAIPDFGVDKVEIGFPAPVPGTTLPVGIRFAKPVAEPPEILLEFGTMAGGGAWTFTRDATAKGRRKAFDLEIPAHLRGRSCRLVVTAPGYGEQLIAVEIPAEGSPKACQVVLARADHTLRGRVVDLQNRPLQGARITIATAAGAIMATSGSSLRGSNAAGEFSFANMTGGDVRLFVRRRGYAGTAVVSPTKRSGVLTIRLEAGEERRVEVGAAGEQGLMLCLLDAHGDLLFDDRVYGSVRHGTAHTIRVPNGAERIQAWRPGAAEPVAEAAVGDSKTIDLRSGR